MTIADVLNVWNDLGVFSYALPFLLIFAVIFAILDKSKLLSADNKKNKSLEAIVAASIGLLALQFDFVSEFYAVIFPRFGVGIAVFLVLLIMLGFFFKQEEGKSFNKYIAWIGWLVGVGVVLWALSEWDQWHSYTGFGGWFSEYIWALIVLGVIVAVIIVSASSSKNSTST